MLDRGGRSGAGATRRKKRGESQPARRHTFATKHVAHKNIKCKTVIDVYVYPSGKPFDQTTHKARIAIHLAVVLLICLRVAIVGIIDMVGYALVMGVICYVI